MWFIWYSVYLTCMRSQFSSYSSEKEKKRKRKSPTHQNMVVHACLQSQYKFTNHTTTFKDNNDGQNEKCLPQVYAFETPWPLESCPLPVSVCFLSMNENVTTPPACPYGFYYSGTISRNKFFLPYVAFGAGILSQ